MATQNLGVQLDPDLQQVQSYVAPHVLMDVQTYRNVLSLTKSFNEWMTKMSAQLDSLTAQVAQNTTVIESAIALIQGFKQRLDDAVTAAQGGDLSKLTDLQSQLASEDQKLADAVAANTPAAPAAS